MHPAIAPPGTKKGCHKPQSRRIGAPGENAQPKAMRIITITALHLSVASTAFAQDEKPAAEAKPAKKEGAPEAKPAEKPEPGKAEAKG